MENLIKQIAEELSVKENEIILLEHIEKGGYIRLRCLADERQYDALITKRGKLKKNTLRYT